MAIAGGYFEGRTVAHPPPVVSLVQQVPRNEVRAAAGNSGAEDDVFVNDDVVVDRTPPLLDRWLPERLSIVVGLCGYSVAAESGFLRTGLPLSFDLDPSASDAVSFAQLVRDAGDLLFVHVDGAPDRKRLTALRSRIGTFDGLAARSNEGMTDALRGTKLMFFDEAGDLNNSALASHSVRVVRRDVTVDDRTEPGYVHFMLERAAGRSRTFGDLVVFMRPMPNSLAALSVFTQDHPNAVAALR